jgi:hypothetical protein
MRRSILLLCLLATPAVAAQGDHFDREAVVGASAAFRSVSSKSTAALEPRERALTRTDQALADLDLSLALSRGAIDGPQHDLWVARLDERSTRFGQEFETLQQELTTMSVGYEQAFEAALLRAVDGLAAPAAECAPKKDLMAGLAQPGGASSAPTCPGENRSADLAAAWDKDAELKSALDAIDPAAFQDVTSYGGEEPPLALGAGSGPAWVHPAALAEALPEAIEAIDTVDRRAAEGRQALRQARADIPDDAPDFDDRRKKIVERARGIRAWSADQKAAIGAAAWESLERNRKKGKKAGWSGAGVCLNPSGWGGCPGDDVTSEVADTLVDDKKLAKALAALLDGIGTPDVSLR